MTIELVTFLDFALVFPALTIELWENVRVKLLKLKIAFALIFGRANDRSWIISIL